MRGRILELMRSAAPAPAVSIRNKLRWLLVACLLLPAPLRAADTRQLEFDVSLEDRPIGTHVFRVTDDPATGRQVDSDARFDVRVLGIRVYRYRHRAQENWVDGCLHRLSAETDDNGKRVTVDARRDSRELRVIAPSGTDTRTGCVSSYAYWDPALLRESLLLNPQTGRFDPVRIVALGRETITLHGSAVVADRHRLSAPDFTIDLWYSPDGQWLQLDSRTAEGRRLRYRLKPPRSAS